MAYFSGGKERVPPPPDHILQIPTTGVIGKLKDDFFAKVGQPRGSAMAGIVAKQGSLTFWKPRGGSGVSEPAGFVPLVFQVMRFLPCPECSATCNGSPARKEPGKWRKLLLGTRVAHRQRNRGGQAPTARYGEATPAASRTLDARVSLWRGSLSTRSAPAATAARRAARHPGHALHDNLVETGKWSAD